MPVARSGRFRNQTALICRVVRILDYHDSVCRNAAPNRLRPALLPLLATIGEKEILGPSRAEKRQPRFTSAGRVSQPQRFRPAGRAIARQNRDRVRVRTFVQCQVWVRSVEPFECATAAIWSCHYPEAGRRKDGNQRPTQPAFCPGINAPQATL
jgi:hypothetical protein